MPRYRVELQLHTAAPLRGETLDDLETGGRYEVEVEGHPRGRRLAVRMVVKTVDSVTAHIRATNWVLDRIKGDVVDARIEQLGPRRSG